MPFSFTFEVRQKASAGGEGDGVAGRFTLVGPVHPPQCCYGGRAAYERAADQRGGWVLIRSRNLSTHCQTAVGFLF